METIAVLAFSLSIDLGKKERFDRSTDRSMPVDRAFVARSLLALAAKIQADKNRGGDILDETGLEVGSWKFSMKAGD
jgi:hypothetical protein